MVFRIQIASLLGYLGSNAYSIYPFLVVVPNTTITNWVREFEKWVPHMRVVSVFCLLEVFWNSADVQGPVLRRSFLSVMRRPIKQDPAEHQLTYSSKSDQAV